MRIYLIIFFSLVMTAAACFAQTPLLIAPPTLEVLGNGYRSLAFVMKLEGVSPEVAGEYDYFIEGLPADDPPSFSKKSNLFYWRPSLGQAGLYEFNFIARHPGGQSAKRNVLVTVTGAVSPEVPPKGWEDMGKEDKYASGKRYFPSTNIIEADIAALPQYELQVKVKDSADADCWLTYVPADGLADINKSKKQVTIRLGGQSTGGKIKRIQRDLYEDLYNYLGLIFKRIDSISITGDYKLEDFSIYDQSALLQATDTGSDFLPLPNISFDDRFYLNSLYSKQSPITISDVPTIKIDFNTNSGLIWRQSKLWIDDAVYSALKGDFSLVVVKPIKEASVFDVNYAMFTLRIPFEKKLSFGEHKFVFETQNAYGTLVTREAFARVVSLPAQVVGKPMIYPNPFSPARQGEAKIQYQLSIQADIELVLFGVDGSVILKKRFSMGEEGAKKGMNTVVWNGRTEAGMPVSNGIYSGVIIDRSENRILEKFLITIYQ